MHTQKTGCWTHRVAVGLGAGVCAGCG